MRQVVTMSCLESVKSPGRDNVAIAMPRSPKNGKSLAVSISSPVGDFSEEMSGGSSSLPVHRLSSRNASSKYDFVKVKVWLGDNADHCYVLSRFLMSRMLTVTKIPNHVAIKIALELKKLLVDNSLLDVSQFDLEANLFKLMERRGFGEEYINRYKMMTRFHHQRVPLVILVCGSACTGKSTIATLLAQRLNLPNVLQTNMVYELLRTSTDAPLASTPVWAREFASSEELITEFCRECRVVRKGLAGDLKKAMKDGKPIIIEGIHLDPSIYLMDQEKADSRESHGKGNESVALNDTRKSETSLENFSSVEKRCSSNIDHLESSECSSKIEDDVQMLHFPRYTKTSDLPHAPEIEGLACQEEDSCRGGSWVEKESSPAQPTPEIGNTDVALQINKPALEKSGSEPIIVPIVLKMADFDHKALLEEWISARSFRDKGLVQDPDKLIDNLRTIQNYLCSFEEQGLTVVNISATTFAQSLDWLHNYLLQSIERGVTAAASDDRGRPEV